MVKESDFLIGVVDDNPQNATYISETLEFRGFRCFEAYDMEDAIKGAKGKKPDLMLLDIKMQYDHEGYKIAREIKNIKVLFIASETPDSKMLKLKNVGGYVMKPFDPEELVMKVRKILKLPKNN